MNDWTVRPILKSKTNIFKNWANLIWPKNDYVIGREITEIDPGGRIYYNNKMTFQISKIRTIVPFMVLGKRLAIKDRVRSTSHTLCWN